MAGRVRAAIEGEGSGHERVERTLEVNVSVRIVSLSLLAALAGCGASEEGVSAERRVSVADELRQARSFGDTLLDLARWYREIYLPPIDFNGDGYADFAAGTSAPPTEQINVYYGSAQGLPAAPSAVLPSPDPTRYLAFLESAHAGDVNGDGYSDLIAGANGGEVAYVYHGGPAGLSTTPSQTLLGANTGLPARAFGYRVASARDVDLDGYDDVMVGAMATHLSSTQDGAVFVYRGGPSGVAATPAYTLLGSGGFLDNFGSSMAATFLDFDPYPDLIVGESRNLLFGGSSTGRVHVFLGGPGPLDTVADYVLEGPSGPGLGFGLQVRPVGDINLDGYGDFGVGEPVADDFTGKAYVYLGTADGLDETPGLELHTVPGNTGGFFSWSLAGGGDLDRDGLADLVVGETDAQDLLGEAQVYYGLQWTWPGDPSNPQVIEPDQTLQGTHTDQGFFGQDIAFVGDIDRDRTDEVLISASAADNGDGRVYSFEGTSGAPLQTLLSPVAGGGFGLSISN
jgi:hypothetical protein